MSRAVESRVAYADRLRVCAAAAVVILHISAAWLGGAALGSFEWNTLVIYDSLMRWCVPAFVMLSGAFLLDPKKQLRARDLFFKHILRVFLALILWGTFYALLDYGHTGWRFTWAGVKSALGHVLRGETTLHLWFLYMILGLYLVTPILRAFTRGASRGTFHWFFALTFTVYSLLPTLQSLWPEALAAPMAWLDKLDIHLVLGYVGYYVAGYYLKTFPLNRPARWIAYVLGVLGAAATVWGAIALSVENGAFCETFFEYRSPNVVCMSVAVFTLFQALPERGTDRSRRRLEGACRVTFGVYLIHIFFITVLRHLGVSTLSFHPALSVPALSAGVLACSFAVSWVISKIPLLGRYLV